MMPPGFYYKIFQHPRWAWPLVEPFIRSKAGLGKVPREEDHAPRERITLHPDVAVIGAGAAGLAAAAEGRRRRTRGLGARAGRGAGRGAAPRPRRRPGGRTPCRRRVRRSPGAHRDRGVRGVRRPGDRGSQRIGPVPHPRPSHRDGDRRDRAACGLPEQRPPRRHAFVRRGDPDQSVRGASRVGRRSCSPPATRVIAPLARWSRRAQRSRSPTFGPMLRRARATGSRAAPRSCRRRAGATSPGSRSGAPGAEAGSNVACDLVVLAGFTAPSTNLLSMSGAQVEFDERAQAFLPVALPDDVHAVGAVAGTDHHRCGGGAGTARGSGGRHASGRRPARRRRRGSRPCVPRRPSRRTRSSCRPRWVSAPGSNSPACAWTSPTRNSRRR